MKRNELLTIAKHFSAYEVRFSDEEEGFDIVNPYGGIRIGLHRDPRGAISDHPVHMGRDSKNGGLHEGRRFVLCLPICFTGHLTAFPRVPFRESSPVSRGTVREYLPSSCPRARWSCRVPWR